VAMGLSLGLMLALWLLWVWVWGSESSFNNNKIMKTNRFKKKKKKSHSEKWHGIQKKKQYVFEIEIKNWCAKYTKISVRSRFFWFTNKETVFKNCVPNKRSWLESGQNCMHEREKVLIVVTDLYY
jgi:hypothetical protein